MKVTAPSAKDHEQQLIDYLIGVDEAVEYGEQWTEKTTHEWWVDTAGERHCRLVQTYHGGGSRGDDDQAEYAQRLLDMGRAQIWAKVTGEPLPEPRESDLENLRRALPDNMTHVIVGEGDQRRAVRFRRYSPPPEGIAQ